MQQEVPAEKFLFDLTSRLRLVRHVRIGVKDAQGSALAVPPSVGNADATRGERAPGWFAALIAPPIASRDVPVVVNGARIGSVEIVGGAARRDRGGLGQYRRARRGGADREHRRHCHSLCPVRTGARSAHRRRPRPRRPRAAQLSGTAATTPRAGACRHHRPLQCARAGAGRRPQREREAQPSADHGPGRRAAPHRARTARRSRPEPVRPQGQRRLDRDGGGRAAGAGGAQDDRARARHAGDHRAPAEHQSQHAQPAAPDGAGTRAVARHPRRAGAASAPGSSRRSSSRFPPTSSCAATAIRSISRSIAACRKA